MLSSGPALDVELLCSVFVTALFNCSLIIGVEANNVSELQCKVGEFGALPLAEEPLSFALPELSTGGHALSRHPLWGIKSPLLALRSAPPQPWECQQSTLVFLRCCFHKASSTDPRNQVPDCSNHVHGLAEGAMEATQILAQPSPTACAHKTHNS